MTKDLLPLGITLLGMILLEVFVSTFLPFLGLNSYTIPFHILIVLYFGLKLDNPYVGLYIFIIEYTHGLFSVEGWELGTLTGILLVLLVAQLKEVIQLSSMGLIVLVAEIFQIFWFFVTGILIYFKFYEFSFLVEKFWRFIPESITLSLLASIVFPLLDKVWAPRGVGLLQRES